MGRKFKALLRWLNPFAKRKTAMEQATTSLEASINDLKDLHQCAELELMETAASIQTHINDYNTQVVGDDEEKLVYIIITAPSVGTVPQKVDKIEHLIEEASLQLRRELINIIHDDADSGPKDDAGGTKTAC